MTLDLYSWGFRRNMRVSDVMDIHTLLSTLVETIRFIFTVYVGQTGFSPVIVYTDWP